MNTKAAMCLWKPVPQSKPFPCDRFKHACSICRGFVYLYGGRCNTSLSDFWRYNIASNEWEKLDCSEDGPEELEEHSMVAYQGILYIFGGMVDSAFTQTKIPLWMYDIGMEQDNQFSSKRQRKYTVIPERVINRKGSVVSSDSIAPANRKGHSAVVYNSSMYIYGGYFDIKGISQEFWALHFGFQTGLLKTVSLSYTGDLLRFHTSVVSLHYSCTHSNLSHRLDTGEWSQVSPLSCDTGPGPRHGHSAVVYGTGMYLFGGLMGLSEQRDLWKWDFTSCKWSTIRTSQRPPKVVGHSSVVFQDSMLTFGGGVSNSGPNNGLWRYHFSSQTWEKLASPTEVILSSKRYHRILGIGVGFQLPPGFSRAYPIKHLGPKGKEPQKLLAVSKHGAHFHGYFRQQPVHQPFSNNGGNEIEMKTLSPPLEPLGFCSFQTSSEAELCADRAQSIFSKNKHLSHLLSSKEQALTATEVTKNRRGTDRRPTRPTSVAVTNHPDRLLLIGGKPLSSLCEISLWQMELNSI